MKIFKRTHAPNGILLTNSNCIYVCSATGSDLNSGTIESPFATITKAISIITSARQFINVNDGVYVESVITSSSFSLFCDKNKFKITELLFVSGGAQRIYDCQLNSANLSVTSSSRSLYNCEVANISRATNQTTIKNTMIYTLSGAYGSSVDQTSNITIKNVLNVRAIIYDKLFDGIITDSIDLYAGDDPSSINYIKYVNFLFRKDIKWMWNGNQISINYGPLQENWISDLKASLIDYANSYLSGSQKDYLIRMVDGMFLEKCIVWDDINDIKVFNKYDANNNILDYTLNLDSRNPALTMSSSNSFIGAYPANLPMILGDSTNVDEYGNNLQEQGDLLYYDPTDASYNANELSIQNWNRVVSNVISTNRGFSFNGTQGILETSFNNGFYYGKKQVNNTENVPVETLEIIPYNSYTEISSFPRFSCSLSSSTEMYYWNSGPKINNPVLFNDLIDLGITSSVDLSIYGDWAVTTADYDSIYLAPLATVIAKRISLTNFKLEINLHYGNGS